MSRSTLRCFSAEDVRRALPMAEAVEVMRKAFAQLSAGEAVVPQRTHLDIEDHSGTALFMPAYLPDPALVGVKIITLFDHNAQRNLPRIQATVCILDGCTGRPLAVLDGTSLTAIRTGAASGLATDVLAPREADSVAIFGAGVQARTQLEAVCAVRPIRQAWVYDQCPERTREFAGDMSRALKVPVAPAPSAAEAAREAAIICTATTSHTPVFDDEDLRGGVHINAVGSYQPWVQELPAETVLRSYLVVDHRESSLAETGDLLIPIGQGLFGKDHIRAELGEVAAGRKPGRPTSDAVTLFKSVGVAIQDLAAAMRVLTRGASLGLGVEVPW